ncbi:Galactokinase [Lactiplantibacillus plantarum]|nr:Galactokinase [Lactiplantibacillus plantarum]
MDQFAVGMGKKDQAILLDTNTMDYSESVKSFTYNNALSLALIKAVMNINKT